ncbi:hypothetical protein, partial [Paenibacillus glacialis]|uniref:hypothetical protein n=1 Tax=Paenibacillus glacialis TaxID=494026 RepID=UPI001B7FF21A
SKTNDFVLLAPDALGDNFYILSCPVRLCKLFFDLSFIRYWLADSTKHLFVGRTNNISRVTNECNPFFKTN